AIRCATRGLLLEPEAVEHVAECTMRRWAPEPPLKAEQKRAEPEQQPAGAVPSHAEVAPHAVFGTGGRLQLPVVPGFHFAKDPTLPPQETVSRSIICQIGQFS